MKHEPHWSLENSATANDDVWLMHHYCDGDLVSSRGCLFVKNEKIKLCCYGCYAPVDSHMLTLALMLNTKVIVGSGVLPRLKDCGHLLGPVSGRLKDLIEAIDLPTDF